MKFSHFHFAFDVELERFAKYNVALFLATDNI